MQSKTQGRKSIAPVASVTASVYYGRSTSPWEESVKLRQAISPTIFIIWKVALEGGIGQRKCQQHGFSQYQSRHPSQEKTPEQFDAKQRKYDSLSRGANQAVAMLKLTKPTLESRWRKVASPKRLCMFDKSKTRRPTLLWPPPQLPATSSQSLRAYANGEHLRQESTMV
ncbi:hypothetical protein TgHK011_003387 [Trichoderma gracile]|nr:hypothetical protein TgHK011_003387 [Trichoderma gracile]